MIACRPFKGRVVIISTLPVFDLPVSYVGGFFRRSLIQALRTPAASFCQFRTASAGAPVRAVDRLAEKRSHKLTSTSTGIFPTILDVSGTRQLGQRNEDGTNNAQ